MSPSDLLSSYRSWSIVSLVAFFGRPLSTYQETAGGQQLNPAFLGGGKAINWNKSGGCKIVRAITEPIIIIFVECDGPVLAVGWFNVILKMLVLLCLLIQKF